MEYFIDTNIFLRILVKENEKTFKECYQFLKLVNTKKVKAFTSVLVIAEIDWVLESFYGFKKEKVIKVLESISKLKGLGIIDKTNLLLSLRFYKKYNVKLIDALIAAHPKINRQKATIVSYDKDFDKMKLKRVNPGKVINLFD